MCGKFRDSLHLPLSSRSATYTKISTLWNVPCWRRRWGVWRRWNSSHSFCFPSLTHPNILDLHWLWSMPMIFMLTIWTYHVDLNYWEWPQTCSCCRLAVQFYKYLHQGWKCNKWLSHYLQAWPLITGINILIFDHECDHFWPLKRLLCQRQCLSAQEKTGYMTMNFHVHNIAI